MEYDRVSDSYLLCVMSDITCTQPLDSGVSILNCHSVFYYRIMTQAQGCWSSIDVIGDLSFCTRVMRRHSNATNSKENKATHCLEILTSMSL